METGLPGRLLAFARELQRAASFGELLDATRAEVSAAIDYQRLLAPRGRGSSLRQDSVRRLTPPS